MILVIFGIEQKWNFAELVEDKRLISPLVSAMSVNRLSDGVSESPSPSYDKEIFTARQK